MTLTFNEPSETKTDEVNMSSSNNRLPMEHEEVERVGTPRFRINDEEQRQSLTGNSSKPDEKLSSSTKNSLSVSSVDNDRRNRLKTRSVSFAPMVEEYEIPARSSISSTCSMDFIDALVESYKLQTSMNLFPFEEEEKKYVRKTTHTRANPNWREHRIRRLMNKLEELTLWDREEELKASQAQFLREQKLEQIQDRQRNHDLCLYLMRQRHESEMESAVLLDQTAGSINDENISATISRTVNFVSPNMALTYNLTMPPPRLKRRVREDQEKRSYFKTPIGRYRQFETSMKNKLDKINENLQTDWPIMRAYNPYYTSIPSTVVPLFGETYATLLTVPDSYSSNRYKQYHNGMTPSLQQSSQHASSPDYETRLRSYSNRDVRVPFKEETSEDHSDDDDNENDSRRHSPINSIPPKRSTSLMSMSHSSSHDNLKARDQSLLHSPQPSSTSIHRRSLNDDLNALTNTSYETNRRNLQTISESSNDLSTKTRSSSKRYASIAQDNDDHQTNSKFNKTPRIIYQPAMISLSSVS